MARAWLHANNLPSKFWFYTLKGSAELSNYFPIKYFGKITTPFELAHQEKLDYRTLFPMFNIAYVRKIIKSSEAKFKSQTVKTIVIGKDD
mmetsp:Transcript_17439/g.24622  ORF Transcript_17439/g.24622 Transcript_17439/m.24622 type:complete len:90 (+) Transcript_17439:208-477(+)